MREASTRTRRDDQQWMLDLALNLRGRVQNFEVDSPESPSGAHPKNYRMYSKVWREAGRHHEELARRAHAQGFAATATEHYDEAIEAYRFAQHPIFYDDHPVKIALWQKIDELVDLRSQVASYPIERVEVPFDGSTISCLLHLLPDRRRAPCVVYVPGMDQTKESFPRAHRNLALERGMHVLSIDGPGQGSSNLKKVRAVGDNYERAGSAIVDYLISRPEIDPARIGLFGISMGSYWSLRMVDADHRVAAVASAVACFRPNNTIFTQCSPRFKQMFMYMAGMWDEEEFDRMAAGMTVQGRLGGISCPVLLVTGEFDPLCPLEDAIGAFEELETKKELWVVEDQFHPLIRLDNLGGLDIHHYVLDWLQRVLVEGRANARRIAYVGKRGEGPFSECEWVPPVSEDQAYF
jgi:dipeptidyl aminopeptidase/acylaminoacyl peptidase